MVGRGVLSAFLVFAFMARAGAQSDEDCLACHSEPDLEGERAGRPISVYVDPAAYAASIHHELGCAACHLDLEGTDFPHVEEPQPVECSLCHGDVAEQLAAGPHGRWPPDPSSPSAGCVRCHGAHDILPLRDPNSPVHPANAQRLCQECHAPQVQVVERSAHGSSGQRVPRASCVECHRGHDVTKPKDERTELETCVACHPRQVAEQRRSAHARAALRGDPLAPTCITCHEHHEVLPRSNPVSPTAVMNVPLLCGRCHREGSPVSLQRDISQDQILENYSMSLHLVSQPASDP